MTMRLTANYEQDDSGDRLIGELIEAFEAVPELEEELIPAEIEIVAEKDDGFFTDFDIDAVAAALAYAYKAGVQAGQIKGVSLNQHDAAGDEFWQEKAHSLFRSIRANNRRYQ